MTTDAVLIENAAGEVELVNEAFCRLLGIESAPQSLFGLPAADVIGKSHSVPASLKRQPLLVDEQPAGAIWSSRHAPDEASKRADRDVSEIALIEKIGVELSVALEGLSAGGDAICPGGHSGADGCEPKPKVSITPVRAASNSSVCGYFRIGMASRNI
jgi:hypothetical protein